MARLPIKPIIKRLATGGVHQTEADKALAESEAADKRAANLEQNNDRWRFVGHPKALDRIDADINKAKAEAKAAHNRYLALTGGSRVDRKPADAPTSGKDKGATGLRAAIGLGERRPPGDTFENRAKTPAKPADKPAGGLKLNSGGPVSNETLGKHADRAAQSGMKAQRTKSAEATFFDLDMQSALRNVPRNRHPDAAKAEESHGMMGDDAHRARQASIRDRATAKTKDHANSKADAGKASAAKDQAAAQSDLKGALKTDAKPGAGDRRTGDQSALHKEAVRQGWREKRTKSGYTLLSPDGKTSVGWHVNPSHDPRAAKNMLADLQRGGFVLPGRRRGDIKANSGMLTNARPIPPVPGSKRLPKTGPGTNDVNTTDKNPIPSQTGRIPGIRGDGGLTLPGGIIKTPAPKGPPGIKGDGSGDVKADSKPSDKGSPYAIRFGRGKYGGGPREPSANQRERNVPHRGTTFQKQPEPAEKSVFKPKPRVSVTPVPEDQRQSAATNALVNRSGPLSAFLKKHK